MNVRPKPRLERALAFVETGQIVFHLKEMPCKIGKPPYLVSWCTFGGTKISRGVYKPVKELK